MTSKRVVPDLVQDSRLQTEFLPDGAIRHTHIKSDAATQQRCVRYTETWASKSLVGLGGFAHVWLQANEHGQTRALKQIRKRESFVGLNYWDEIEITMRYSHHRYVHCFIRADGWFEDADCFYISMEFHHHGDLNHFLKKSSLTEMESQVITSQVTEALYFMHGNKTIHRDVKPANILIVQPGPYWWVKLGDFSISKLTSESDSQSEVRVGTMGFMAPELLLGPDEAPDIFTTALDVWGLGETVHRLLTGEPAFNSIPDLLKFTTTKAIFKGPLLIQKAVSGEAFGFVKGLLNPEPGLRFTTKFALSHPWIDGLVTQSQPLNAPVPKQAWTGPHLKELPTIEPTTGWTTKAWITHSMESLLRSPPVSSVLLRITGYVKSTQIHMPQTAVIRSVSENSSASVAPEASSEPGPELEPSEALSQPAPTNPNASITERMTRFEAEMSRMRQDTNRVLRQLAMTAAQPQISQVRQKEAQEEPESLNSSSALLPPLSEPASPAKLSHTPQRQKFSWRRLTRRAKTVPQSQGIENQPST